MVQSRFSWGYYGAIIPSVLNVLTMQGYLIINCIIGGQTLASVSSHLDDTLGIVIIGVISLLVSLLDVVRETVAQVLTIGHLLRLQGHTLVRCAIAQPLPAEKAP